MYLLMYFYSIWWCIYICVCVCYGGSFCQCQDSPSLPSVHSLFWVFIHRIFRSCNGIHTHTHTWKMVIELYPYAICGVASKQTRTRCIIQKEMRSTRNAFTTGNILMLWTFFWDSDCIIGDRFLYLSIPLSLYLSLFHIPHLYWFCSLIRYAVFFQLSISLCSSTIQIYKSIHTKLRLNLCRNVFVSLILNATNCWNFYYTCSILPCMYTINIDMYGEQRAVWACDEMTNATFSRI